MTIPQEEHLKRIEPDSAPEDNCTLELVFMASIAISLKRIADSLAPPTEPPGGIPKEWLIGTEPPPK